MDAGFELIGVVHLVRPLLLRATSLEDLRAGVAAAPPSSLFYHAVQCRLRASAAEELPPDDWSAWIFGVLQDREAAERISFAVQSSGAGDALRGALLAALDAVPEAARRGRTAPPGGEFVFLAADSVPVPTGEVAESGEQLIERMLGAEASVWFYHLIEQPWYHGGTPAPVRWLEKHGEKQFAGWLEKAADSGRPIEAMRRGIASRWRRRGLAERVRAASRLPEGERAAAGRDAVAGLVRRLKRPRPRP